MTQPLDAELTPGQRELLVMLRESDCPRQRVHDWKGHQGFWEHDVRSFAEQHGLTEDSVDVLAAVPGVWSPRYMDPIGVIRNTGRAIAGKPRRHKSRFFLVPEQVLAGKTPHVSEVPESSPASHTWASEWFSWQVVAMVVVLGIGIASVAKGKAGESWLIGAATAGLINTGIWSSTRTSGRAVATVVTALVSLGAALTGVLMLTDQISGVASRAGIGWLTVSVITATWLIGRKSQNS
jgi:hypothetical protein